MFGRRTILEFAFAGIFLASEFASAQAPPYGSISPTGGTFDVGTQLQVHIEFCSPGSFFDSWGTVRLNGVTIGSTQPGSASGCSDFQSGDFTITIAAGANTVTGDVSDGVGPAHVEATYTGTPPPPPPPPTPLVSLAPHHPGLLVSGSGVAFAHSTPAYFSLGQARGITVAYNSATVKPTPVILFDVSNQPGPSPTAYSVQVRRDNSLLTLINGSTTVYYTPATTTPLRLSAAFDAQLNQLGTGWHDITVTVTSHFSGGPQSTTVATRVLVVDQTGSPFGKGVDLAGVQRIHFKTGSYSVLVTEGDGSAAYFENFGNCETCSTFTSPAGDATVLSKVADPTLDTIYRRRYPDGSVVDFTSDGRIARALGIFGDTTRFIWTDTLLTQIRDPIGKTLTLAYAGGKLQSATDPAGRVTSYAIDGSARLYRVTDPDSVATNLAYDGNNLLTSVTDRGGAVSTFTYDALRRVDTTYAPMMQIYTGASVRPRAVTRAVERVVWQPERAGTDTFTKKLAVRPDTLYALSIGPLNDSVRIALDRFGGPTKVIGPYGETTTITRDTLGLARVTTEPNGHITRLSWNNYLVSQTKDSTTGRTITYQYGVNANVRQISGHVTQQDLVYHTGASGPSGALDSVLGANRAFIYSVHRPDALGRDTMISDGAQHKTRMKYDSIWGNVREIKDANGNLTIWFYDSAGRVDSARTWRSPWGAGVTRYRYDALNRQTEVTNRLGQTTRSVYGPTTLNRVIDPKGQVYKFAYNPLGLLVARHDVADTLKADTVKYDEAGNARTAITRRGDVITMTYDLLGRILSRAGPDFPVDSFKYDPASRWIVGWNVNQRDSAAFDQVGRLASTRQAMLGGVAYQLSYTYDIRDRLLERSAPTGGNLAKYRYNAASGPLDTLCGAGACVAFKRNGERLRDTMIYNPGGAGSWKHLRYYDSLHAVTRDSFNLVGLDTLFGGRWSYDEARQLYGEDSSATGTRKRRLYLNDAIGRLLNACDVTSETPFLCYNEYGQEWQQGNAYAYDSAGNRIDPAANAVIGAGNRVSAFKGYSLVYDANGNLISKTGPGGSPAYTYIWDALGRLKEVQNSGLPIATYKYDALGRRVSGTAPDGTAERYVYDRDHVALDVNGSHVVKREYGYGEGMDRLFFMRHAQAPAWTGVVLKDPVVGTVRGIANLSGGALRKKYQLTAWGETPADTGVFTRIRMAGREYDQATKLYYMRARYYDPELGRFLSEDPIGIVGGLNLYVYAGNDPINLRDPTGLDECAEASVMAIWASVMASAASDTAIPLDPITVCGDQSSGTDVLQYYCGYCYDTDGSIGAWLPYPPASQPPPKPVFLGQQGPSCGKAALGAAITIALDITTLIPAVGGIRAAVGLWKAGRNAARLGRAGDYTLQAGWGYAKAQSRAEMSQRFGAAGRSYAIGEPLQLGAGFATGIFPGTLIENVAAFIPGASSLSAGYAVLKACGVL